MHAVCVYENLNWTNNTTCYLLYFAQKIELQAKKEMAWIFQGSCFRAEKITVLGKALYHCDPAEEIQLDTNV